VHAYPQQNLRATRAEFRVNAVCNIRISAMKKFCTDNDMSGPLTAGIDQKRPNQCRLIRGDSPPQRTKPVAERNDDEGR
jgi:hypothetical protein